MENNPMVSVVLLGEVSPPDQINHFLTQIVTEQTHKNLELELLHLVGLRSEKH